MSDIYGKTKRSEIMSNVKNKNTKPEMKVKRMLCDLGYGQYRLFTKKLYCRPDIVYVGKKKAIFVNGCFWHGHTCKKAKLPETNHEFWKKKIDTNQERDRKNYEELKEKEWTYCVVWECELKKKNEKALLDRLTCFMEI